MKKQKLLSLFSAFVISLTTLLPVTNVNAETQNIEIGDYLQMGTYYGKPILWRCVDIDENGPLMLSDKIICLKAFDISGRNTLGSHKRKGNSHGYTSYSRTTQGSNYWKDSNIRCWLNSNATAGNVEWLCGNPPVNSRYNYYGGLVKFLNGYSNESGFLTNFSDIEIKLIKSVLQKSILDGYEYSNTINADYLITNSNISSVVQNFDSAYSEQVNDKVFLLDVKQLNKVYQNDTYLGGNNYYLGSPTAEAVSNSEYKHDSIQPNKVWVYWLRTPYAEAIHGSTNVRTMSDGSISSCEAIAANIGVRPAFYLNQIDNEHLSGVGSVSNPYTVIDKAEIIITEAVASQNAIGFVVKTNNFNIYNVTSFGMEFIPKKLVGNEQANPVVTEYKDIEMEDGATFASVLTCIPNDWQNVDFVCTAFAKNADDTVISQSKYASINDTTLKALEN